MPDPATQRRMIFPAASNQPRGLRVLFFTEMWERFSYYGMRALLVLYLVTGLAVEREDALKLYAIYTAFVYLTPILGGHIADRWLGANRAVLVGGLLMSMGHFTMMFPDKLYLALTLLIMGNGFFKPNISTMVGRLYGRDDPRRDGGFTLFYMGINLGAFLAPLICGALGEKLGWHYGFGAAGVGMLLAVLVFSLGQGVLQRESAVSQKTTLQDWLIVMSVTWGLLLLAALGVTFWENIDAFWKGLPKSGRVALLTVLVAVAVLEHFLRRKRSALRLTRIEIHRVFAILILGFFVVLFWMGFEQAGGTMNLFALDYTDRRVFGWVIPASYFQALNPLMIFLLAPLFSILFVWIDHRRGGFSAPGKMALGMIILGFGFLILAVAQEYANTVGRISPMWLVLVYLFHTIGELFLSPVGLSMVTRLAPVQIASLMMGVWFTAIAVANYLAGTLEAILLDSGYPLYWFLVMSSMGAGLLLLLLSPWIKRLMHEEQVTR